jgi:peptidylamidoglycolate lyase
MGGKGSNPGEFNIPHSITLDSTGNVYVADRENSRIQVFSMDGKFLKQIHPAGLNKLYSVAINQADQQLFATDYLSILDVMIKGSDIYEFDSSGNMLNKFGRSGNYSGPVCRYHDMAMDREGNIYVCDILKNSIQKFLKQTAD